LQLRAKNPARLRIYSKFRISKNQRGNKKKKISKFYSPMTSLRKKETYCEKQIESEADDEGE